MLPLLLFLVPAVQVVAGVGLFWMLRNRPDLLYWEHHSPPVGLKWATAKPWGLVICGLLSFSPLLTTVQWLLHLHYGHDAPLAGAAWVFGLGWLLWLFMQLLAGGLAARIAWDLEQARVRIPAATAWVATLAAVVGIGLTAWFVGI